MVIVSIISPKPFLISAWKNLKQLFLMNPNFVNYARPNLHCSYDSGWLVLICLNVIEFLSNTKASTYWNIVYVMFQNFQALGAGMSIKLHNLFRHLDYFPQSLGDVCEEQGERFHQDIRTTKERYQGHWDKLFFI